MASIDNPAVVNWYEEEVRPLADKIQVLKTALDSMNSRYNTAEITNAFALYQGTDRLDAGEASGVPIQTKDECITWVANAQALIAALDVTQRMEILTYPKVQPPRS
jgi:hypothetical protein